MIGAMPAVAVRHERRKQEKKKPTKPGQLYLANYATTKQTTSSNSRNSSPCPSRGGSPSPASQGTSPMTPPHLDDMTSPNGEEFYVCARVSVLHVIVVSFLLGIILLIVGLVQLKPGADASDHRYYILGAGSLLLLLGTLLTLMRCIMIPVRKYLSKRRLRLRRMRKEESAALALAKAAQNGNGGNGENHHDVQTIEEVSSAEERAAAAGILQEATNHHRHHHGHRNGSTSAILTSCQSVSIEMGPHSSRDTLVSARSPSEHDGLLQRTVASTVTTTTSSS